MLRFPSIVLLLLLTALSPAIASPLDDGLTIGGEWRTRYTVSDDYTFNRAARADNDVVYMRSRLRADYDLSDGVFIRLVLQDSRRWGDPASNASNLADAADIALKEGYAEFIGLGNGRIDVALGRQTISLGEERAFSEIDWHVHGLSHDAAVASLRPTENQLWKFLFIDVNENDNTGTTAAAKGGVDADAYAWGIYGRIDAGASWRVEPYWVFRDYDSTTLAALAPQASVVGASDGDFKSHTVGALITGEPITGWSVGLEGQFQTGEMGTMDHEAYMAHARLARDLPWTRFSRVIASYDVYSGDKSATDRINHSYQPLFPNYYRHGGYAGRLGLKNLELVKLSVGGALPCDATWRLDWRRFWRDRAADHIYNVMTGVLFNAAAQRSTHIGDLWELILARDVGPHVTVLVNASWLEAGAAIREAVLAAGGQPSDALVVSAQVEVKF